MASTIKPNAVHLSDDVLLSKLADIQQGAASMTLKSLQGDDGYFDVDVCIAGSGPIAATYASTIIENHPTATVLMVEIGSQDTLIAGEHQKNDIKYQREIDLFADVIRDALQPVPSHPSDTHISSLGGDGNETLITEGHDLEQRPELNLRASAVTRTVGGMATHWTGVCPEPHTEERKDNPIKELDELLQEAKGLLNVHTDQYDDSIRHTVIKEALLKVYPDRGITNLPLAAERRTDDPDYVTWTGTDRLLKPAVEATNRFNLLPETRFTKLIFDRERPDHVRGALIRDLRNNTDKFVLATAFVIACGAIGTPQVLFNSGLGISSPALGHYFSEQSLSFCQIVLKSSIVESISKDPRFAEKVRRHQETFPKDPLPIPFNEPEPQVLIPYTKDFPWHVQVHRESFSYGDVGARGDSRVVVDLRFFGRQESVYENRIQFGPNPKVPLSDWKPEVLDIYGMPQFTFEVTRSDAGVERDQRMMKDMIEVASVLGPFLPGSAPELMEPGLAFHLTGTTRIGEDPETSVADPNSKVHQFRNLWVGGNGCIPDSTACNPTLTSVAIALKGARSVASFLKERK